MSNRHMSTQGMSWIKINKIIDLLKKGKSNEEIFDYSFSRWGIKDAQTRKYIKRAENRLNLDTMPTKNIKQIKKTDHDNHGIYLFECQNYYKIGYSKNVHNRLQQISVGVPFEIKLIHHFYTEDYSQVERTLHFFFRKKQFRNEWYKLTKNDVNIIKSIIDGSSLSNIETMLYKGENNG